MASIRGIETELNLGERSAVAVDDDDDDDAAAVSAEHHPDWEKLIQSTKIKK